MSRNNSRFSGFVMAFIAALVMVLVVSGPVIASEGSMMGFKELDDVMVLSFKDAVNYKPVEGATVILESNAFNRNLKTDHKGLVEFDLRLIETIQDGTLKCTVYKKGYIPFKMALPILQGTLWKKRFYLSKELPLNKVRFVLEWDDKPRDLDLHLLIDSNVHISYRNMRSATNLAKLDRDDLDGYGPETITLDRIAARSAYQLYVHNYSGERGFKGNENVFVYANNKLDRILKIKKTNHRKVTLVNIREKKITYNH